MHISSVDVVIHHIMVPNAHLFCFFFAAICMYVSTTAHLAARGSPPGVIISACRIYQRQSSPFDWHMSGDFLSQMTRSDLCSIRDFHRLRYCKSVLEALLAVLSLLHSRLPRLIPYERHQYGTAWLSAW